MWKWSECWKLPSRTALKYLSPFVSCLSKHSPKKSAVDSDSSPQTLQLDLLTGPHDCPGTHWGEHTQSPGFLGGFVTGPDTASNCGFHRTPGQAGVLCVFYCSAVSNG